MTPAAKAALRANTRAYLQRQVDIAVGALAVARELRKYHSPGSPDRHERCRLTVRGCVARIRQARYALEAAAPDTRNARNGALPALPRCLFCEDTGRIRITCDGAPNTATCPNGCEERLANEALTAQRRVRDWNDVTDSTPVRWVNDGPATMTTWGALDRHSRKSVTIEADGTLVGGMAF